MYFKLLKIKFASVISIFLSMYYTPDLHASSVEKFSINIEGFFDELNIHAIKNFAQPKISGTLFDENWVDERTLNLKGLSQSIASSSSASSIIFSPNIYFSGNHSANNHSFISLSSLVGTDQSAPTILICEANGHGKKIVRSRNFYIDSEKISKLLIANIDRTEDYEILGRQSGYNINYAFGKLKLGGVDKPILNGIDISPLLIPYENFPYALQRVSTKVGTEKDFTSKTASKVQCKVNLVIPENWILNFKEPKGKINMTGTYINTLLGKLGESCQMSIETIDSQDPMSFQLKPHSQLTIRMLKASSLSLYQDSYSKLNIENLILTNPNLEAINSISIGEHSKTTIADLQSSGNIRIETDKYADLKVKLFAKVISFIIASNSKAKIIIKSELPHPQTIEDFIINAKSYSDIFINILQSVNKLKLTLDNNATLNLKGDENNTLINFLEAIIQKYSVLQGSVRIGHISSLSLGDNATADFKALDDEILPRNIKQGSYSILDVPNIGYKRVLGLVPTASM